MKFQYIFLFLVGVLMLGCGSDSSQNSGVPTQNSKYLTIKKGPTLDVPVSINKRFAILFSSEIDPQSVNNDTVYIEEVYNSNDHNYSGSALDASALSCENGHHEGAYLGVDGNRVTLTPYKYLSAYSTSYKIVVTTSVRDIQGRSLAQDYVYQFTTQSDSSDNSPLGLRSTKPVDGASNILPSTDIIMDFNKMLSSEPQYDGENYFTVIDANNNTIAGTTEVFNSLLKFIPKKPLPYDSNISVSFNQTVYDMNGQPYSDVVSWSFKTRAEVDMPKSSEGFKVLSEIRSSKNSFLLRGISVDENSSEIVVETQDGLDAYTITFGNPRTKPNLSFSYHYPLNIQVTSMVQAYGGYLFVGTINDGVYLIKLGENGFEKVGHYALNNSIYSVATSMSENGINKIYIAGPQVGVKAYDFNNTTGAMTLDFEINESIVGEALDVAEYYDFYHHNDKRIYVADYKGYVHIFDENGTKISLVAINGSAKKLKVYNNPFNQDSNNKSGVYVSDSAGKVTFMDFNGSIDKNNSKISSPSTCTDITAYTSFFGGASSFYYATDTGIAIVDTNSTYIEQLIDKNNKIVSADIITSSNFTSYGSLSPFLITLTQDGSIKLYNALFDDVAPKVSYTYPEDGETDISVNTHIYISLNDIYLDEATINDNSFILRDMNSGSLVGMHKSINQVSSDDLMFILDENLSYDTHYTLTIKSTISDMLGHQLNSGIDQNISFTTQQEDAQ